MQYKYDISYRIKQPKNGYLQINLGTLCTLHKMRTFSHWPFCRTRYWYHGQPSRFRH